MERIKLQEFMTRKGFTQQQFAEDICVKRELVGAWNTCGSDLTRENMSKLLEAGMFIDEIFLRRGCRKDCRKKVAKKEFFLYKTLYSYSLLMRM